MSYKPLKESINDLLLFDFDDDDSEALKNVLHQIRCALKSKDKEIADLKRRVHILER